MGTKEDTTIEYRFFGLPEAEARERLADLLSGASPRAELAYADGEAVLRLAAGEDEAALADTCASVRERMGAYLYSDDGTDLPHRVVELLRRHGKTVATAESCTGGLIASMLTGVPGCSAVLGTGVVSYSNDCKMKLLGVRRETLAQYGAVSARTAGEMARGVREHAGADIGVSVTGEAGPQAAGDQPVGTVFIALADARRTWVRELHLSGDRDAVRRTAANHILDLIRRYWEAYPAVMAGGTLRTEEKTDAVPRRGFLTALVPWHSGSVRVAALKSAGWLLALIVLVGGVIFAYLRLSSPRSNQQLQDSLGDLYRAEMSDLTDADSADYPDGMIARFRTLYDMNPDVAGWVRIADTPLNYPFMSHCGGHYVNHNFSGQFSVYGQPYLLFPSSPEDAAGVWHITGTNTRDEQMFSSLLSYRRIAYLREHPVIEMDTLYGSDTYRIFAVAVADGGDRAAWQYAGTDFADAEERAHYIAQLRRRSLFTCNADVSEEDSVLLLSTDAQREYGQADARLVIAARPVKDGDADVTYTPNANVRMPERWSSARRTTKTAAVADTADEADVVSADVTEATTAATTETTREAVTTTATAAVTESTAPSATVATDAEDPTEPTVTTASTAADEPMENDDYDDTGN